MQEYSQLPAVAMATRMERVATIFNIFGPFYGLGLASQAFSTFFLKVKQQTWRGKSVDETAFPCGYALEQDR